MSLPSLPNELLLHIAHHLTLLPECRHLASLLQTNRRLSVLLQPLLDRKAVPVDLGRRKRVLHWAAERGYERLAGALLENGSYVGSLDCNGWTPLLHAAANGYDGIVRRLLDKGANIEGKSYWGDRETALHCAVLEGQEAAVRVLLERGAQTDVKAQSRATALHFAVEGEKEMIVRCLLEKGAGVNVCRDNEKGEYAIHMAVRCEDEEILTLLLDAGSDHRKQDSAGNTALHLASGGDTCPPEMMKTLLERGADYALVNTRGETSLHIAAKSNNTEAVFRMLRLGAGRVVNARDRDGNTPLLLVAAGTDPVEIGLKRAHSSSSGSRHRSFERTSPGIRRSNTEPTHDVRAAALAVETVKTDIIKMLLENGAAVNHQGARKQSALHLAALNGYEEMARVLLENGADPTLKDESGRTALEMVEEYVTQTREGGAAGRGTVLGLKALLRSGSIGRRESVQGLRDLKTGLVRRDSAQGSPGLRELRSAGRRDSMGSPNGLRELRSPPPGEFGAGLGIVRKVSKRSGPGIRFPIRVGAGGIGGRAVSSLGEVPEAEN